MAADAVFGVGLAWQLGRCIALRCATRRTSPLAPLATDYSCSIRAQLVAATLFPVPPLPGNPGAAPVGASMCLLSGAR